MKKIMFILFAVLMTAITACSNHRISCEDLTFIKQDDTTVVVYDHGKLFNGLAYVEGYKGVKVLVDNGKFFSITKSKGGRTIAETYPTYSYFYDQDGNIISKEIFDKLYPDATLYTFDDILKLCQ